MNTTSTTSPGTLAPTSLDEHHPTVESMFDVWRDSLKNGGDPERIAQSMCDWFGVR